MTSVMTQLGDVAEFINGVAFRASDWCGEGKRIIRIQNLTDPSKPFNRTTREVPKKYEVAPGELLVSWSATLGVFVWPGPDTALVNQHIFRVEPRSELVNSDYLRHMLATTLVGISRHLHGATMKHVNRREFLSAKIPLPPLAEQKRIAAILDAADGLRAKRREALAQLDTLLQSTFLDMFGDPRAKSMRWELAAIGDVAEVKGGKRLPKGAEYSPVPTDLKYIRVADLKPNRIQAGELKSLDSDTQSKIARYVVGHGDVIISIAGTIGITAVVPKALDGANLTENAAKIVISNRDEVLPTYVSHALQMPHAQLQIAGQTGRVTIGKLALFRIQKLEIPMPPPSLQVRFTAVVRAVEEQRELLGAHLAELDTLFASLQQRAFRGDL